MLVAIVLFSISGFAYLYLGYWPVTHEDAWQLYEQYLNVPLLELALRKHKNHAAVFPNLLESIDVRWFHGYQLPLVIAGMTFLLLTVALLLLPVWRDKAVECGTRLAATLAVIVGNLWMVRGEIIGSGYFNAGMSLVMGSVAAAFVWLPAMRVNATRFWTATTIVVVAGWVASLSFGGAPAVWPTLLFLAWCLRLPKRTFVVLGVATVFTAICFVLLPPRGVMPLHGESGSVIPVIMAGFQNLFQLLGSPMAHAAAAWRGHEISQEFETAFPLALWSGAIGLAAAIAVAVSQLFRRNLGRRGIEYIGMAVMVFTLFLFVLVATGRSAHFVRLPFEVLAPRYLFWSTLFWMGLLVVIIRLAEPIKWLRWTVFLLVLTIPVWVLPSHYHEGAHFKYVRILATAGATSLINGVRDVGQVTILSIYQQDVFRVAEQMRARRLDMFAAGLQDYIGRHETDLFNGRERSEGLKGECRVDAMVPAEDGTPAARVVGCCWTLKDGISPPNTLVIVDPRGVIRGVARTASVSKMANRILYRDRFAPSYLVGYIRNYDVGLEYSVRSADAGALSTERMIVQNANPEALRP